MSWRMWATEKINYKALADRTQVCFLIDLPRLAEKAKIEELTGFAKELIHFTEALGIEKGIVDSIRRFDFSRTKNLAFLHSM